MNQYEYLYTDGKTLKGAHYVIACRSKAMREAGAAPYVVYVDDTFYCTCETLCEAKYEVKNIEEEEVRQ